MPISRRRGPKCSYEAGAGPFASSPISTSGRMASERLRSSSPWPEIPAAGGLLWRPYWLLRRARNWVKQVEVGNIRGNPRQRPRDSPGRPHPTGV
jgi:hypothetical protein